jgi:hypothetical protein
MPPGKLYDFQDDGAVYCFTKQDLSVHSIEDIHATFKAVLASCMKAWGWPKAEKIGQKKNPFYFTFFSHPRSVRFMGMAHVGAPSGWGRLISMSKDLLKAYDLGAIGRLMAHEIAHHYREGNYKLPLFPSGGIYSADQTDCHDEVFWKLLKQVDPLADPKEKTWEGAESKKTEKLPPGKLTVKILNTIWYIIYVPKNKKTKEIGVLWQPGDFQSVINRLPKGTPRKVFVHPKSKWGFGNFDFLAPLMKGKKVTEYTTHPILGTKELTYTPKKNQYLTLKDFIRALATRYPGKGWKEVKT